MELNNLVLEKINRNGKYENQVGFLMLFVFHEP